MHSSLAKNKDQYTLNLLELEMKNPKGVLSEFPVSFYFPHGLSSYIQYLERNQKIKPNGHHPLAFVSYENKAW